MTVSLTHATLRAAERMAKAMGKTRRRRLSDALSEYVANNADGIETFNAVADAVPQEDRGFEEAANRRVFERNPW